MSWKVPIVRQVGWLSIIPQLLLLGLLTFFYYSLGIKEYLIFGSLTYLGISFTLRGIITKYHRKGIKLMHEKKYTEAIELSTDYNLVYIIIFVSHNGTSKYPSSNHNAA
jgi:hypothetical protein